MDEKSFDMTKRDFVFTVLLCVTSLLLSAVGVFGGFNAGFTVTYIFMFTVMTVYFWKNHKKIRVFPVICSLLAVMISLSFFITSNSSVRILGFFTTLLLSFVWYMSLVTDSVYEGDLGILKTIFNPLFFCVSANIPKTCITFFSFDGDKGKTVKKIILGIGISIPVLIVVVPLLMSSDAAFSGLVEEIASNTFLIVAKIFVACIIALVVVTYCLTCKKENTTTNRKSCFEGVDNAILISFLSVLSICYITYLISQLAYFFSAFKGFLPEGYKFTFSEYARRGFFEMSVIAAINFVIVFVVLLISRKYENQMCIWLKLLCTFISMFTLIIIVTAMSKMALYIKAFGMTRLRITTSCFMVFLTVVFISLIMRIYCVKIAVLKTAFVTAGIVLTLLGVVNVNHVVASYNYNAYKNGVLETIDVEAIYELGDEGVPFLAKLSEDEKFDVAEAAKERMLDHLSFERYYEVDCVEKGDDTTFEIAGRKYDKIEQYTVARERAYQALDTFIEENENVVKRHLKYEHYYS